MPAAKQFFWHPDPVQGGNSHGSEFIFQNSFYFANNLRPAKNYPSFSSIQQIFWSPYMQYLESCSSYIV